MGRAANENVNDSSEFTVTGTPQSGRPLTDPLSSGVRNR
jgi:hypothetical protein